MKYTLNRLAVTLGLAFSFSTSFAVLEFTIPAPGRVDAVVETPCGIYVFEFKLNGTAEEALAQIMEKGYHEKYLRAGKKLTLAGVAFDAEMRNLSDRKIEVVEG